MSEHPPSADRPTGPAGAGHPEIDQLASYAAGDIDVAEGDLVRAHVSDCADCLADLAALERARVQLSELTVPPMPADVAGRLDAAIEAARSAPASQGNVLPVAQRRRTTGWATGAVAAVMIALVAAVAVGSLQRSSDNKDAASTAATAAGASVATGRIYSSGTKYTATGAADQVNAVLRGLAGEQPEGAAADRDVPSVAAAASASSAPAMAASTAAAAAAESGAPAAAPAAPQPATSAAAAPSASAAASAAATSAAPAATGESANTSAAITAESASAIPSVVSPKAPPADLAALRGDPARLAACIASISDNLVQPIALDFASFQGKDDTEPRPALAIVFQTDDPAVREVFIVGGECGTPAAEGTFLHYATIPAG